MCGLLVPEGPLVGKEGTGLFGRHNTSSGRKETKTKENIREGLKFECGHTRDKDK